MNFNFLPEALTSPLRLKLLCCLISGKKSFAALKNLTEATDGNISEQLSKLEAWNYIRSEKSIQHKRLQSIYEITPFGLKQLEDYVSLLQSVLE